MERTLYDSLCEKDWNIIVAGSLLKKYKARRFYEDQGKDTLELAIDARDLRWIKALVESGEDMVSLIQEDFSPLLLAHCVGCKTVIEYMNSLYDVKPESLLYLAVQHRLASAVKSILGLHQFDNQTIFRALSITKNDNPALLEHLLDALKPELEKMDPLIAAKR